LEWHLSAATWCKHWFGKFIRDSEKSQATYSQGAISKTCFVVDQHILAGPVKSLASGYDSDLDLEGNGNSFSDFLYYD